MSGAWPSVALNVTWLAIGLAAVLRPARWRRRTGPDLSRRAGRAG